jgi:hypothetical protein
VSWGDAAFAASSILWDYHEGGESGGEEDKRQTDMILNQYRVLPNYTLLTDLLSQTFIFLALASMANRMF